MHIVMLLASRGEGGLEKHVRELSAALVQAGQRVTVVADPEFVATLAAGVGSVPLNMQRWRYHPWLRWQLRHILLRLQPDVVHAHANKATALLAGVRVHLPSVATLHNLKQSLADYRAMQVVIAPSQSLADSLNHPHAHVVYHGVPPWPDSVAVSTLPPNPRFTLCAIGRLVPAKGLQGLMQAVDGLPLTLLIAGEGPLKSVLQAQITQLSPETQVRLLGQVQDVPALLAQCQGLVIASGREGFAYVCAEALLGGVPVIATHVPVANELLPPQWLVPVGDVPALRDAIQRAMRNPLYWRESQTDVFAQARTTFSMTRMVQATLDAYCRAIHLSP